MIMVAYRALEMMRLQELASFNVIRGILVVLKLTVLTATSLTLINATNAYPLSQTAQDAIQIQPNVLHAAKEITWLTIQHVWPAPLPVPPAALNTPAQLVILATSWTTSPTPAPPVMPPVLIALTALPPAVLVLLAMTSLQKSAAVCQLSESSPTLSSSRIQIRLYLSCPPSSLKL